MTNPDEDYLSFIQQINLYNPEGEKLSEKMQIPSNYKTASYEQLEALTKELYFTYVKQLEALERSTQERNELCQDVQKLRAQIDEIVGRVIPSEMLLQTDETGEEKLTEENEPKWE